MARRRRSRARDGESICRIVAADYAQEAAIRDDARYGDRRRSEAAHHMRDLEAIAANVGCALPRRRGGDD